MSRMKMLLEVVHDLRELAAGLEALAQAVATDENPAPDDANAQEKSREEAGRHGGKDATPVPFNTPDPLGEPLVGAFPPEKVPTLMELRQYASDAIGDSAIRREQVRRILTETFRVNKLTELPQAQYPTFVREVKVHVR